MEPRTIVIKKYENRRLYDTANSRYINLDEVAQLVQDGMDVQVVDAGTGEDLTRLVLTQIIVEEAKTPNSNFPLDVLRQMVVASGRASQESTLKYMKAVFDMYQSAYRALPSPLNPFGLIPNAVPGAPGAEIPGQPGNAADLRTPSPGMREPKDEAEVRDLRRRIEELESVVAKRNRAAEPAKKKNSRRH